ncbi:hypothetical protein Tcan_06573 [Toxocara canis]|uniref:Uncharacterized protein n=1 Tax=Toxocara canis TaxID=6265 RepID=A0A0B2V701_TOXCA|nr:hypothetical protein Tcan_06573 [Toxocara canis]
MWMAMLLVLLALCMLAQQIDGLIECLNCVGAETLHCDSSCIASSCFISVKNDMSLEFGCSEGVHSDICVTTVSLKEVQSVSCYCSTNACNGDSSSFSHTITADSNTLAVAAAQNSTFDSSGESPPADDTANGNQGITVLNKTTSPVNTAVTTISAPSHELPAAPGRAVTRDERISTVVNSILNQIETIVNKFKNDTDPLVRYVVGGFQDNQEKLKQQVNELLPSLS